MSEGTVKWYNTSKGFGFITPITNDPTASGNDIFFHSNNIAGGGTLNEGQEVTFDIEDGRKGPEAMNVQPK